MNFLEILKEESTDIISTSFDNSHSHYARVNKEGYGKTTATSTGKNHTHLIKKWRVMFKEGHTHEVKKINRRKK
jgi:hypothetical protein